MKAEFWRARWEQGLTGWHKDTVNSHLEAYWPGLGLDPAAPVFVPLCGKSIDMLWLRARGHPVVGVEVSPIAVEGFFRDNGLSPQVVSEGPFRRWSCDGLVLLEGDFFDLAAEDMAGVAAVFDRASLIALPPAMRGAYADHLGRVLPAAAQVLLVTIDYPQGELDGPPFAVADAEVRSLFGDGYAVSVLYEEDALAEHGGLCERGLTRLTERVYRLDPTAGAPPR